jgi:hypothetical protein
MAPIQIMSVIGSAVPASLRAQGQLACWYLVRNGEAISGPLTTRSSRPWPGSCSTAALLPEPNLLLCVAPQASLARLHGGLFCLRKTAAASARQPGLLGWQPFNQTAGKR